MLKIRSLNGKWNNEEKESYIHVFFGQVEVVDLDTRPCHHMLGL